jgi:hypothetical protein
MVEQLSLEALERVVGGGGDQLLPFVKEVAAAARIDRSTAVLKGGTLTADELAGLDGLVPRIGGGATRALRGLVGGAKNDARLIDKR